MRFKAAFLCSVGAARHHSVIDSGTPLVHDAIFCTGQGTMYEASEVEIHTL